jgi:hypothetical protein
VTDGRSFCIAVALAENNIINARRVGAAAADQFFQDTRAELPSVERGERAEEFSNGRSKGRAYRYPA